MKDLVRYRKDLVRYRALESLCRQSAVFHPLESWRLLAEAEMWHHKAEQEIASRALEPQVGPPVGAVTQAESPGDPGESSRSLAG